MYYSELISIFKKSLSDSYQSILKDLDEIHQPSDDPIKAQQRKTLIKYHLLAKMELEEIIKAHEENRDVDAKPIEDQKSLPASNSDEGTLVVPIAALLSQHSIILSTNTPPQSQQNSALTTVSPSP